jgi:hypothetical protein
MTQLDLSQAVQHVPHWTAANHDGEVYAFSEKPVCLDGLRWTSDGGQRWYLGRVVLNGIDCRDTLRGVDDEQEGSE